MHILFSHAHSELLSPQADSSYKSSNLLRLLEEDLGYTVASDESTVDNLSAGDILVFGAPTAPFDDAQERLRIEQFVESGGGLLVFLSNSEMIFELLPEFSILLEHMGMKVKEYHNYQYKSLQVFQPHYITANIRQIQVKDMAFVQTSNGATPLIFTKTSTKEREEPMAACATIGRGRVVVLGDVSLASDRFWEAQDNKALITNALLWLSSRNPIDIRGMDIPETIEFGRIGTVALRIQNSALHERPDIECILTSDNGAVIPDPVRHNHAIPSGKIVPIQWNVKPQVLGDQQLRLIVKIQNTAQLLFDHLPDMHCIAPGYLTLEIRKINGNLATAFETGEYFTVEGALHSTTSLPAEMPYSLQLELGDGLIETKSDSEKGLWQIKAMEIGHHDVVLRVVETGQSLPAVVIVRASENARLTELKAAYVRPLEAEIIERLRLVDERLVTREITELPFELVSPWDFIKHVDCGRDKVIAWFQDVLVAAYREQWDNPNLLDTVLSHFAPTYIPGRGSYIPYAPELASALGNIHPEYRKTLEYNLLCSEESDEITIKQNIAAYLLHEKFGHGFFYTQTRLGRQLAILLRHGFPTEPDCDMEDEKYPMAASLISDSAIIVNEGFAAWLELVFLEKLGREVKHAVPLRHIYLMQNSTGLVRDRLGSEFFEIFPPRSASRYREGFEYLNQINLHTRLQCTIRLYMLATDIDFGIRNINDRIEFQVQAGTIHSRLTNQDDDTWRSHSRLYKIANLLYRKHVEIKSLLRRCDCPERCRDGACPLEAFVIDELQWRS